MKETRIVEVPVEARAVSDSTATIAGYAAVFGTEYPVWDFTESVDPKAFNKSLKERGDLAVVWSHDADRVLGTRDSDTARFTVDDHGLHYEADLDLLDPDGVSAYRKIATGKVRQSSFSFEVVKDSWEHRGDAPPHRTLKEVRLWEASPVLWGANPSTEVDLQRAARSLAETMHVDAEVLTISEVLDLVSSRDATTTEPPVEPPQALADDTPEPEPVRATTHHIVKGLNG